MEKVPYKAIVGCIMCVMITIRLNIVITIRILNQFVQDPRYVHLKALEWIMKYLQRYAWLLASIYKNGEGWWNDVYNLLWFKLGWNFGQKKIDYWIRYLFFGQCNSKFGAINNNLEWQYLIY
jgi:hypothetical protein